MAEKYNGKANESGVFIMEPISDRVIEQLKCGEMGPAAFMPSSDG